MRIVFLTGSRSEWGYIRPILRQIERDPDLDYELIVTNMHLLPAFGSSIREIEQDGFRIAERIYMVYDGFTGLTMTKSLAALLSELPGASREPRRTFSYWLATAVNNSWAPSRPCTWESPPRTYAATETHLGDEGFVFAV